MFYRRITLLTFVVWLTAPQTSATAQQSPVYRSDGIFTGMLELPTVGEADLSVWAEDVGLDLARRYEESVPVDLGPRWQQAEEPQGRSSNVWRGLVTGLGVGAVAAMGVAVWVSAGAGLELEEVVDFYVPVVAVVGAAGGAVLEAARDGGGVAGFSGGPGVSLAASLPF
ncbi:MAG: hypothetical protein JSU87_03450 [Gemmatimonadota bacterium]|nr:MAG: hypothetical protein JSU87_03450 [Gemmatimonadota bacterium]